MKIGFLSAVAFPATLNFQTPFLNFVVEHLNCLVTSPTTKLITSKFYQSFNLSFLRNAIAKYHLVGIARRHSHLHNLAVFQRNFPAKVRRGAACMKVPNRVSRSDTDGVHFIRDVRDFYRAMTMA